MTSEIDKYYQSGNTNEQDLYKAILRDAGVDDRLIQSSVGFANLSQMINQVQIKHGEKFSELNQDNVNELVNTIKNEWEISDGHVLAEVPLSKEDQTSQFYAKNKQTARTVSLDLIGNDKIEINQSVLILESEFGPEAQDLLYADMPYILENGNRIDANLFEDIYQINPDGNDILLETTSKRRVSTLENSDFQYLQQSLQTDKLSEMKKMQNRPDEYWGTVNKSVTYDKLNLTPYSKLFATSSNEKVNLSEEQLNQMVENIYSNSDSLTKEEIIQSVLQQLGVSENILKYPKLNEDISKIVQTSIENNPSIGDITTKEGTQNLLRQLDKDLIIGENYVSGKVTTSDDTLQEDYERLGKDSNTYLRQDAYEIYIDNEGLVHRNNIVLNQVWDEVFENNNSICLIINQDLYQGLENGELNSLNYIRSGKYSTINGPGRPDLTTNAIKGLSEKSIEYWDNIQTIQYQPDIVVDEAKEDELIQSYDNYDITTEDMQVAHDTLEQTLEEEQNQQQEQTNENQER